MRTIEIPVPEGMDDYAHDLRFFFETMVRKMDTNRHKNGKGVTINSLKGALLGEVEELEHALENESQFAASLEAVDVANFAFLLTRVVWSLTREQYEDYRVDTGSNMPFVSGSSQPQVEASTPTTRGGFVTLKGFDGGGEYE